MTRHSFRVRVYAPAEWRALFRTAGLRLTAAYSGYGRPYRPGAGRLIVSGRRGR